MGPGHEQLPRTAVRVRDPLTSLIALVIATVLSLALAILMGEYFRTGAFASIMSTAVELLAGIPSVVYGFIGLFFLVPAMRVVQLALGMPPFGVGILTSSILLAFMILPYSASIGREMISLVPSDLKEAALSLGATRSETVWKVTLPYARSGIMGGVLLSLGRALGETMAVTMVIGNSNYLTLNVFSGPATPWRASSQTSSPRRRAPSTLQASSRSRSCFSSSAR